MADDPLELHVHRVLQRLPAGATMDDLVDRLYADSAVVAGRHALDALRQSEERFRQVFEHSALGIALINPDGFLVRCNRALERIVSYTEGELRGRPFSHLTHPEDAGPDAVLYAELASGERSFYQREKRYIRKDGQPIWVRVTTSRLPGPRGEMAGIIGLVEDVSQTKVAAAEQQRLVYTLGERVKELEGLHETARLLQDRGGTRSEVLAGIAALLPPAFQYVDVAAARVGVAGEVAAVPPDVDIPWQIRATFTLRDGSAGFIETGYTNDAPFRDKPAFLPEEQRLIDSMAEMLRVALDHRLAEHATARSEERLSLALMASDMGVWEHDLITDRVHWTPETEAIFGLEPGQFDGVRATFRAMVHPDDLPDLVAAVAVATDDTAGDGRCRFEFRQARSGRHARWTTMSGQVFRDAAGKATRIVGVVWDTTARHVMEEQLHHAQKMDAVGRLASGVAHDFNNLLSVINANCAELLNAGEPPSAVALIQEIREVARRAHGLTRQLLAFSPQAQIHPEIIDPGQLVEHVAGLLRRLVGPQVELVLQIDESVARVRGDSGQIEQVLMNLAVNARDAMSPQGGKLTVRVANVDLDEDYAAVRPTVRPGPYVIIAVTDTGCGMDRETLAHIFEPFYTTKGPGQGTGLGLAVVFGIVERHGGHLAVYSELGLGSTFQVLLPRLPPGEGEDTSLVPKAYWPRGSETVLVVEDEPLVNQSVCAALEAQGYRVLSANDGANALEMAQQFVGDIHLLLTDRILPRMTGHSLAEALSRSHPDTRVIHMSGYPEEPARAPAPPQPPAFLHKPFSMAALVFKVREILDRSRS